MKKQTKRVSNSLINIIEQLIALVVILFVIWYTLELIRGRKVVAVN